MKVIIDVLMSVITFISVVCFIVLTSAVISSFVDDVKAMIAEALNVIRGRHVEDDVAEDEEDVS